MSIYANHLFKPGTRNNSWAHLYEYVNEKDRVLDVGCSTGYFGEALMQLKGCEVWGVDLDEGDVKDARQRLTEALVLDINDTKGYKELGKFDVIIFADVLEHLIDPRATLRNVKQLLTDKGRVIFSIPHMAHSSVRLDLLSGKFPYKNRGLLDNTHLHFYDMDEAKNIFTDSGYAINTLDPVVSQYPHALILKRLQGTGIRPDKTIEQYFTKTNGDVFQIVGCAQPSAIKEDTTSQNRNYVMPQDEMYELIQNLRQENEALKAKLEGIIQ